MEGNICECLTVRHTYGQIALSDGTKGVLICPIHRLQCDDCVVDWCLLVGCHVSSSSGVIEL